MSHQHDHELGMDRKIRRRDFINGAAVAARFAATGSARALAGVGSDTDDYPPALTGMRGSGYPGALYDEFLKTGGEPPHLRARQPFGHIAIANTASGADDTTELAIDMAARALGELNLI